MKKIAIIIMLTLSIVLLAGCRQQSSGDNKSDSASSQMQSKGDSGSASGKRDSNQEAKTITGTLDEKKDFMFVVLARKDDYYAFSFEDEPEGLNTVKVGDRVIVTYTGEISVVDAFRGTVLSVKKAD